MDDELYLNEAEEDEDADEASLVVKFDKPYVFEGKEYTEVDLSGLEDMKTKTWTKVMNTVRRSGEGFDPTPQLNPEYSIRMAATATNLPVEFFELLPYKEGSKVHNRVMVFSNR
ncbi:MAG: phage tail assembly protein [Lachnospiraceae bacterium]|nr:phage tail assembly protein [Lachnospiraceae bacterium]